MKNKTMRKSMLSVREMALFSMLGMLMFCSKIIMEAAPNIHLLGMLIMVYTLVFRTKALIPIYIYVFVNGLYGGFAIWWIPYLYVWTVLWGMTMLLPKKMPKSVACVVYPTVCALHGFLFGVLYAPSQMLLFGLRFEQAVAWVASGFYFDVIHGISNLVTGTLVLPLSAVLRRLVKTKQA